MTATHDDMNTELDSLLAGLGQLLPAVPDALMQRVLADAVAVQAMQVTPVQTVVAVPVKPGFWHRLVASLGGNGAIAGLGSAAVAGVVLGYLQPTSITGLTTAIWGETSEMSVDLLADTGELWAEG
jgi:hypothetical protein